MATKTRAAAAAEQLRVSQVSDFKARMGGVMELPSGLIMKLKNPGGLQAFIANGTIPNSLLGMIQDGLNGKSGVDATKAAKELSDDLSSLGEMLEMMNTVLVQTAKDPKVYPVPTPEDLERYNILHRDAPLEDLDDLRIDDFLYVDEIEEQDKQFVFQWVSGGVRDLETFRAEQARSMAAISAGEGSEGSA